MTQIPEREGELAGDPALSADSELLRLSLLQRGCCITLWSVRSILRMDQPHFTGGEVTAGGKYSKPMESSNLGSKRELA